MTDSNEEEITRAKALAKAKAEAEAEVRAEARAKALAKAKAQAKAKAAEIRQSATEKLDEFNTSEHKQQRLELKRERQQQHLELAKMREERLANRRSRFSLFAPVGALMYLVLVAVLISILLGAIRGWGY